MPDNEEQMTRLEQLQEFLKKEPTDPFLNYALAMELEAKGSVEEAYGVLSELYKRSPDYSATYYHLGRLLIGRGLRDEALSIFEEGMKVTRAKKEQHLLAELQSAYNNLLYDDE